MTPPPVAVLCFDCGFRPVLRVPRAHVALRCVACERLSCLSAGGVRCPLDRIGGVEAGFGNPLETGRNREAVEGAETLIKNRFPLR